MTTYFARHTENIFIDRSTRARIWNENLIAVHYPYDLNGVLGEKDNASLQPDDYERTGKVRSVIGTLRTLAKEGGYVCAEHWLEARIQIGWVPPDSRVNIIEGTWEPLAVRSDKTVRADQTAILKTIRLQKVQILPPLYSVRVLAGRPRHGTLQRWPSAELRIEKLVDGISTEFTLSDLLPYEQETMCAEFLRIPEATRLGLPRLVHLLLPVGRTMKDVDIVGIDAVGRMIVCQVTHDERSASKLSALRKYDAKSAGGHPPILFCQAEQLSDDEGIQIFPIQEVFDVFTATESGKRWLSALKPST